MSNGNSFLTTPSKKDNTKNENDRWRNALLALIFLLLSFGCIFCSSQGALWFINEDKVDASMLSQRTVDYDADPSTLAQAPLNGENLAVEIRQDKEQLAQTATPVSTGMAVAVHTPLPLPVAPESTAIALVATPTPTAPSSESTPDSSAPTSSPTKESTANPDPTNPPTSTSAPPTPVPATPTLPPPTPTVPAPTPTLPLPTPTLPPPTPTLPPPTSTPAPPATSTPVPPANKPPTAANDAATTNEDTAVNINVLANDSDSDGTLRPDTVTVTSGPTNGATAVNLATGVVTYTPNGNYNGNNSFTYQVCDDDGACDTATVAITVNAVNDPPVAVDDAAVTIEDVSISAIVVLGNDSDPDGDGLTVISVGTPFSGTTTLNVPGYTVRYTPNKDIYGTDSFTYTISDGVLTDTATVAITIHPTNDAPVAVDDAYTTTLAAAPLTIPAPGLLDNDTDADPGDTLTVNTLLVSAVTGPSAATVAVNADGSFTFDGFTANGDYTFTYRAQDSISAPSNQATVRIRVNP